MSEKELGQALLNLDAQRLAGVGDTREQTWKILESDRNRVWWWTAITFALWGIAIFMVMLMMVLYALVFPLQAKLHQEEELVRIGAITPEQQRDALFKGQIAFQMVTLGVTCPSASLAWRCWRPCCLAGRRVKQRCGKSMPACWRSHSR